MENIFGGISCSTYTVKQLAQLFGKSEDAIRRWKNEGLGREDDNIKLRALEREDGSGRKNSRHLVFSREAVIEFVKANPFLMDEAPQLAMMMQAEGAWRDTPLPMPGESGEDEARDYEAWDSGFDHDELIREHKALRERLRAKAGFGAFDDDEPEEDSFRDGWRRPIPRRQWGGRNPEADMELRRREKIVNFALDSLRKCCADISGQADTLAGQMAEVRLSGMGEDTIGSVIAVMEQKRAELEEQREMLEEFIEVIEDQLD